MLLNIFYKLFFAEIVNRKCDKSAAQNMKTSAQKN